MYTDARHHAQTNLATGYAARGLRAPVSVLEPSLEPRTFELTALSFGATADYDRRGGQPVISDDAPESAPVDLAVAGIKLPRDWDRHVTAAFVIGAKSIRIRARLVTSVEGSHHGFIRAFAGGQERVGEYAITFENGIADVDLPVVGISTAGVGVVQEDWTWECRLDGGDFHTIEFGGGENAGDNVIDVIDTFPVRLYFTAGRTISRCPRESFYHVACTMPGAKDAQCAERDVWRHFTAFRRGRFLTNARGERLGFWRDYKPGVDQDHFIARTAQDLITLTDSSCRGWAELFREALAAHGIASTVRAVRPKLSAVHPKLGLPTFLVPDGRGGRAVIRTVGILVKPFKWKPQQELSPFPFTREQAETNAARFLWKIGNPVDPHAYNWPDPDAIDLMRPGHTSPEEGQRVHGMFGNHAVVLVERDGKQSWYDPSFGFGPHRSLIDYENDLLGRGDENHGGLFAIIGWKRDTRSNPETGQIEEVNGGLLLGAAPPPAGPVFEAIDPE